MEDSNCHLATMEMVTMEDNNCHLATMEDSNYHDDRTWAAQQVSSRCN